MIRSLNPNYRDRLKGLQILLSKSQSGPGRIVKQEQEEISHNHVERTNLYSRLFTGLNLTLLPGKNQIRNLLKDILLIPSLLENRLRRSELAESGFTAYNIQNLISGSIGAFS